MKDKVCLPTSDTDDMTQRITTSLLFISEYRIGGWSIFMFTVLELSEHSDIGSDGRDPIK